jgi:hypothetical protein
VPRGDIWINDATFGNSGTQLQYNSGSLHFYVGNGSTEFLRYTSSGIEIICAGGVVKMDSDGLIIEHGSGDPHAIRWVYSTNTVLEIYAWGYADDCSASMVCHHNASGNRVSFGLNPLSNNASIGIYTESSFRILVYGYASALRPCLENQSSNPSTPSGGAALFARSGELRAMDSSENITVLTPHRFEFIPDGPREPVAWTHYGERGGTAGL